MDNKLCYYLLSVLTFGWRFDLTVSITLVLVLAAINNYFHIS